MPARNINKIYVGESYYHVYNRGVNKAKIFLDNEDYEVFLGLLKRYLDDEISKKPNRAPYPNYADKVELLAYCLMPNHFHLFLYQLEPDGMNRLLKSIGVAYSMYFNKKYKRVGPVFQQRYKAVYITNDEQLQHISRYIHLNPKDHASWQWSSLAYYLGPKHASWVKPERILLLHRNTEDYRLFIESYKDRRDELAALKNELAG